MAVALRLGVEGRIEPQGGAIEDLFGASDNELYSQPHMHLRSILLSLEGFSISPLPSSFLLFFYPPPGAAKPNNPPPLKPGEKSLGVLLNVHFH